MEDGSGPSREALLVSLKALQQVSQAIEELLHRVRQGHALNEAERARMQELASQQGNIVEAFVGLSDDRDGLSRYRTAEEAFQIHLHELQHTADPETLPVLREQVSASIEEWVGSLEEVIRGVLSRAS